MIPTPSRLFTLGALGLAMLAVVPAPAWAYVDPGTGSYFFQIAAAGLLAAVYTCRSYWQALTTTLRERLAGSERPDGEPRGNDME
jgi:hypothetical protein